MLCPPAEFVKEFDPVLIRCGVRRQEIKDSLGSRPSVIEQEGLAYTTSSIQQCEGGGSTLRKRPQSGNLGGAVDHFFQG